MPKPLEVVTLTRARWQWEQRFTVQLASDFQVWANWKSSEPQLLNWYASLRPGERSRLTPAFDDEHAYNYRDQIWCGWVYEDFGFEYKAIPKSDKDFVQIESRSVGMRRFLKDDWELEDSNYPYLGKGDDPRSDRLFQLAFGAANAYYRAASGDNENREDGTFGRAWLRNFVRNPSAILAWYASLSDNERKLSTPLIRWGHIRAGSVSVLCYESGRARMKLLPKKDVECVQMAEQQHWSDLLDDDDDEDELDEDDTNAEEIEDWC